MTGRVLAFLAATPRARPGIGAGRTALDSASVLRWVICWYSRFATISLNAVRLG